MPRHGKPRLVITPGDPRGIGAEVTVRALARRADAGDPVDALVVGDEAALRRAGWCGPVLDPGDTPEPVEVRAILQAVEAVRSGRAASPTPGTPTCWVPCSAWSPSWPSWAGRSAWRS